MIATVFASGMSCLPRAICWDTGFISDVPVRFAPGASLEATSPEAAGSVTAVKRTGMVEVFSFTAEAEGVATARIRSEFSLIRVSAIDGQLPVSAAAESSWIVMFSPSTYPASASPSIKPCVAFVKAVNSPNLRMPIFNFSLFEFVPLSEPQDARQSTSTMQRSIAMHFFALVVIVLFVFILFSSVSL